MADLKQAESTGIEEAVFRLESVQERHAKAKGVSGDAARAEGYALTIGWLIGCLMSLPDRIHDEILVETVRHAAALEAKLESDVALRASLEVVEGCQ